MIVYYTASEEKPENPIGVKFYNNQEAAKSAASEDRLKVFSFEVNDKLKARNFGMDTILVFRRDLETKELKFMASGNWLEVHKLLNVPFYYAFESRSKVYVAMTLNYFNSHYLIVQNENAVSESEDDADDDLAETIIVEPIVTTPKQEQPKNEKPVETEPVNNEIDADVLSELFGVTETPATQIDGDLSKMLF